MELVLDVWEGNQDILRKNVPAKGIIVRLNDMNGGHHPDANFADQWAEAVAHFEAYTLYFVYNDWVSGAANYNYLRSTAPSNTPKRVMIDNEVKYPGTTPEVFGANFATFLSLIKTDWHKEVSVYSGNWFLPSMVPWPTDIDYWWMYYPYILQGAFSTWEQAMSAIDSHPWPNASLCPGKIVLWQASSSQATGGLPGCNGHNVDINKWPGTLAELQAWFGNTVTPTPPPTDLQTQIDQLKKDVIELATVQGKDEAELVKRVMDFQQQISDISMTDADLNRRLGDMSSHEDRIKRIEQQLGIE